MAKKNDEPESVFGKMSKDEPPVEEVPVVEYPKHVVRYADDGTVAEDVIVQNEDEEKAVKANWAKEDVKEKKAEK